VARKPLCLASGLLGLLEAKCVAQSQELVVARMAKMGLVRRRLTRAAGLPTAARKQVGP
jgi:hypothetical protein